MPESVDNDWKSTIATTSNGDLYRAFARGEALEKEVKDQVTAKYVTGPTTQRLVQEIAVSSGVGQPGDGDEVKIRLMVFSPQNSESGASSIPLTDTADWDAAKSRADAAVAKVRQDQSQFATMAADTKTNDDQYFNTVAGEVPWIPGDLFNAQTATGNTGLGMTKVAAAVYKDGLAPDTILDPIQEPSVGWVVVQFQGRRVEPDQRIATAVFLINSGSDFATQARSISEAPDASSGGQMGWVSPYQLTPDQERSIFQIPVGRVSAVVQGTNGFYVYKVLDEKTRVADAAQQAKLKDVVYSRWLTELQGNALVWQDTAALQALAPSAAT